MGKYLVNLTKIKQIRDSLSTLDSKDVTIGENLEALKSFTDTIQLSAIFNAKQEMKQILVDNNIQVDDTTSWDDIIDDKIPELPEAQEPNPWVDSQLNNIGYNNDLGKIYLEFFGLPDDNFDIYVSAGDKEETQTNLTPDASGFCTIYLNTFEAGTVYENLVIRWGDIDAGTYKEYTDMQLYVEAQEPEPEDPWENATISYEWGSLNILYVTVSNAPSGSYKYNVPDIKEDLSSLYISSIGSKQVQFRNIEYKEYRTTFDIYDSAGTTLLKSFTLNVEVPVSWDNATMSHEWNDDTDAVIITLDNCPDGSYNYSIDNIVDDYTEFTVSDGSAEISVSLTNQDYDPSTLRIYDSTGDNELKSFDIDINIFEDFSNYTIRDEEGYEVGWDNNENAYVVPLWDGPNSAGYVQYSITADGGYTETGESFRYDDSSTYVYIRELERGATYTNVKITIGDLNTTGNFTTIEIGTVTTPELPDMTAMTIDKSYRGGGDKLVISVTDIPQSPGHYWYNWYVYDSNLNELGSYSWTTSSNPSFQFSIDDFSQYADEDYIVPKVVVEIGYFDNGNYTSATWDNVQLENIGITIIDENILNGGQYGGELVSLQEGLEYSTDNGLQGITNTEITLPTSFTFMKAWNFASCENLEKITWNSFPYFTTYLLGGTQLKVIDFRNVSQVVEKVDGWNFEDQYNNSGEHDFNRYNQNVETFNGGDDDINGIATGRLEYIVVPDILYNEWSTNTRWSALASYLITASDYDALNEPD